MSTPVLDEPRDESAAVEETPDPSDATRRSRYRTPRAALLFTVGWAAFCNLVLELLQHGGDAPRLVSDFLVGTPVLFLLGTLVVWAVLLAVVATLGRLWVPAALLLVGVIALGLADNIKLQIRAEPVYPSDVAFVGTPGFLAEMVQPGRLVLLLGLLAVVAVFVLLVGRVATRRFPRLRRRDETRAWRRLLWVRLAVVVACCGFLTYASHFNTPGNLVRAAYDAGGSRWTPWFQAGNYLKNGFVGGTLFNLKTPAMAKPAGYSEATMHEVAARYVAEAAQRNAGRDPHALDDVNIVVVLSESFSDPTRLAGVRPAEDPIPFTRRLMGQTSSGNLLAHQVGGGTANVEFETLTGMSLSQFAPQLTTPYQMLVPQYQSFPSAVGYFRAHGHRAVAVHPYLTQMYRRKDTYPVLGFQQFVDQNGMHDRSRLAHGQYISDSAAFGEVERQISTSDDPLFVNLVTMQNHGPYPGQYDDPIGMSGLSGDAADQASDYLRGLRHSDLALQGFLSRLETSGEKTVVVFYGDHQPGFWPRDVRATNGDRRMKETPYFIWSSFRPARTEHTSTVSPVYLLPETLDVVGAPLPPYYALLDKMQQEIPGMDLGSYIDDDDHVVPKSGLSPRARALLRDYRLVQYDLSVGKRYSLADMFQVPRS
ncbi:MAG: LTA synthase family protein [Nocardioidaceae bacterium]|nr:LTA synthase family protein [Nocardioidaceae bacterium]